MSKQFTVTTYDYDIELGRTIIVGFEDFNSEEKAMEYAKTIEHTISSRTVVRGQHGYKQLAIGSRRNPIK